ncbi:hypothetical protein PRO82_000159 [Candidatus Protochlamydia amoebophila]|nr:hypothetical protein [Candidatus Protochlamydia amoebophila]
MARDLWNISSKLKKMTFTLMFHFWKVAIKKIKPPLFFKTI